MGGETLKNKQRTILCLLIATVFLMPLTGNTACASEESCIYHFNSYDDSELGGEAWETNPWYMVDGNPNTYASTTIERDIELLNGNNCRPEGPFVITMVEIRARGYYTGDARDIILRPVFGGTLDGNNHYFSPPEGLENASWSDWFDITDDPNSHTWWNWTDVQNLDCDVESGFDPSGGPFTLYCSLVEIRVTFIVP